MFEDLLVYHIIDFVQKMLRKQLPYFLQCILYWIDFVRK